LTLLKVGKKPLARFTNEEFQYNLGLLPRPQGRLGRATHRIASCYSFSRYWYCGGIYPGTDALASTRKLNMPSVKELFDLARQCYAESNRRLNPYARESLRDKGDQYLQKGDELRRIEIIRGVFPNDKKIG